jgi:uncharacterized protein YceH (UPF0502 family)
MPSVRFQAMDIVLNSTEARVLGCLIEKEITTPEYYPLSLNALVNACNQKSNRDPVMLLNEEDVRNAINTLRKKELAGHADNMVGRVTKYQHTLSEVFNFDRRETAIICELLLRGPQTPGELRGRAERMYPFDELSEVQSSLQRLMNREPSLVKVLPRLPGTKEARYVHLLSGDVEVPEIPLAPGAIVASLTSTDAARIARLEGEVNALRKDLADLKKQFNDFRQQFQ